ncbi:VOC family protein [Salinicola sp. DM10]|uniref:VOC family protein n=1 Tax=Salinicola sp. DM10 TaxID=2815721 RepID=UPI001A9016E5|nr:VOC family protein [Salinicola sp. DM10]MCE3026176.1 VOC family protein [Salinicola sp. DM10]
MSFGIDHPLVAVGDLDHAAAAARKLGFNVNARHQHPWGTDNHLLFFSNNFIELIGIGRPECLDYQDDNGFQFGRLIEARLTSVGDGIAMLALDSDSIQRDHALVASRGFADARPIIFRRQAHLPSGGDTEVSVALDILHDVERPFLTQFLCQQLRPELFRIDPTLESHPNGATSITDIWYVSDDPTHDIGHFARIHGCEAIRGDARHYVIHTHKGDCHLLDPATLEATFPLLGELDPQPPRAVALSLACRDLDATQAAWEADGVEYHAQGVNQADIAPQALGTLLRFVQQ